MSRATWSKSSMEREEGWFCQKTKDKYGLKARTQHDQSLIQHRTCRHVSFKSQTESEQLDPISQLHQDSPLRISHWFARHKWISPSSCGRHFWIFRMINFFEEVWPELFLRHSPYIISSSSLKSPSTLRMTFCIMAWVTFTLSLLHIRVGFILPLRALTQVCLANGYGRWGLLTASASDEVYGLSQQGTDAFVKRAGWATAHIVGWNQTTSFCSEVLTSDPCGQSCGGGGN